MPDWVLSLISGLLGALIGAFATLRATQHALKHQNKLLEKTFQNQLQLQVAEYRLVAQLQLLRRLYEFFAETAFPIYATGHNLRNDWAGQLVAKGKNEFSKDVAGFRDQASSAARTFGRILEENRHQTGIYTTFYKTLSFQAKFFEPVQLMLESISKLPDHVTRDMLSLMDDQGRDFGKAVDEFSKWITDGKAMAIAMQSHLLASKDLQSNS